MKLKLEKTSGNIPEGDYQGVIIEHSISADGKFIWFKIEIESVEALLNISMPIKSVIFNTFAMDFADESGVYDTDDFVDTEIEFSLIDRTINGKVYSKFSSIKAIMEEE